MYNFLASDKNPKKDCFPDKYFIIKGHSPKLLLFLFILCRTKLWFEDKPKPASQYTA